MDPICNNRFVKLKRYEDSLRKSMESFNKIFQQTNLGLLFQNSISYQFRHLQLKKKHNYIHLLNNKASISHLNTISAHSKKISELHSQNHCKEVKYTKKNPRGARSVERIEVSPSPSIIKVEKQKELSPEITHIIPPYKITKDSRPKTVSPAIRGKSKHLEPKKTSEIRIVPVKLLARGHMHNKSMDADLSPWTFVEI